MESRHSEEILDDEVNLTAEIAAVIKPAEIELPKKEEAKTAKVEKSRFRAMSLGVPILQYFSTSFVQEGLSSARISPSTSSSSDLDTSHSVAPPPSPSSASSDSPKSSSTGKRKEGSKNLFVRSHPGTQSPKPSPKISSPKHSPRLEIKSSDQEIPEGELPLSKEEAALLLSAAMEKFKEYTDDTKRKKEKEIAGQNKLNGFSILVKIKTKTAQRNFWLVVTGNYRSGSVVYLIDMNMKLGEGANASTFMAYDLQNGTKVAARALNSKLALQDFSLIAPDLTRLIVAQRFAGLFFGEVGLKYETYVIFMPYVPGKILIDWLYKTNSEIKKTNPLYKDIPEYYERKIQLPYVRRFDFAIATVKPVQVLHDGCVIHRDISPDNLLIHETAEKLSAELVDFDEMVDMGCDIFSSTIIPTKENLFLLPFDSNAAYIRVGDKDLFYVNKHYRSCVRLRDDADLRSFDSRFVVTDKARRLSSDELKEVNKQIGHIHTPPKIKGELNVAYGYAAPELCKVPADVPGYQSDLYMLGVLLLHIFADENIQQELMLHFKAMMIRNGFHRIELPPEELKKMAPSIFQEQHPIDVFDPKKDAIDNFVSRYIYRRFMLPRIRKQLEELLSEDPAARLFDSSLQELHKHLSDWRLLFVRLTTMLMSILVSKEPDIAAAAMRIINAVAVMQDVGLRLKKLAPFMREDSGKMTALDELLKEKESELARAASLPRQISDDFITSLQLRQNAEEEAMRVELQRVKEKHQRRTITYTAMESLILGWEQLKDDPASFELLEALAKCLFHTDKEREVVDFMKQLKPTSGKEEKLGYKR